MFFRSIKSRALLTLGVIGSLSLSATSQADWFDDFRNSASDEELYALLYAMPKGGDLHHHISGSARSEWWYEEILRQESLGYTYYTKVTINNCRAYGGNEFNFAPYLLLFRTVSERNFQQLPECEKSEYKKIQD